MLGASSAAPTAIAAHGAGERKYSRQRGCTNAPAAKPTMRNADQYLVSIAMAAPAPASAPAVSVREEYDRTNNQVAPAHTGISSALELNLSGWKLNTGAKASSTRATARFSSATNRIAISQLNHSASATLVVASR